MLTIEIQEGIFLFFISNYRITSQSDKHAVYLDHELKHKITEMKPWYYLLSKHSISQIILAIWLLWSLIRTFIRIWQGTLITKPTELFISWSDQINILFIFVMIVIILLLGLDKFQLYLFPKVFFNLGKQKKELEKIEQLRNIIFIVIGAGIIVGVIASLIASLIMK